MLQKAPYIVLERNETGLRRGRQFNVILGGWQKRRYITRVYTPGGIRGCIKIDRETLSLPKSRGKLQTRYI
jgi:hypothetical protein